VTELFSTLHFSLKHRGSVSATAQQQTYCATKLEQGGVKVPAPSVHCWRKPRDDPRLMDTPAKNLP